MSDTELREIINQLNMQPWPRDRAEEYLTKIAKIAYEMGLREASHPKPSPSKLAAAQAIVEYVRKYHNSRSDRLMELIGEYDEAEPMLEITAQPATPQTPGQLAKVRQEARDEGFDVEAPRQPSPDTEQNDFVAWVKEVARHNPAGLADEWINAARAGWMSRALLALREAGHPEPAKESNDN